MIPVFIDFEASSLSVYSYPIEIAWSLEDGSIESYLISPQEMPEWTDWDIKAERIHGIKKQELLKRGKSALWVCNRVCESLVGKVLYSDYPLYDRLWMEKLLKVCNPNKNVTIEIKQIDDLLMEIMCPEVSERSRALTRMVYMKFEARKIVGKQHRASWDVEYLIELWKMAHEYRESVYGQRST
jgi:hypothetical protein